MSSVIESPQYKELSEQIGSFIEYWGFKQVHGKIWTLVFLSPEPIDANTIIKNLEISKALASMSLKDLLYYNVILEVEKDKPGTQKYTINPNITEVILDIVRKREVTMLKEIQKSCGALQAVVAKEADGVSPDRMENLTGMVNMACMLLDGMVSGDNVDFKAFDQMMTISDPG